MKYPRFLSKMIKTNLPLVCPLCFFVIFAVFSLFWAFYATTVLPFIRRSQGCTLGFRPFPTRRPFAPRKSIRSEFFSPTVKVTMHLQGCLACKRCSASSLNCRYLNSYIKLKLIGLAIRLYQKV